MANDRTGNDLPKKRKSAKAMAALVAEFDRKIETFEHPDTAARMDAVMNARGRTRIRPKAGESF
jgi:hypothetical protein